MDDGVATVVSALKATGMYENAVIFFNADNGGELPYDRSKYPAGGGAGNNFPLKGGKFSLFEGGLRARAFIHSALLPASRRGATFDGLAHTSDIYPTFASMAGLSAVDIENTGPYPVDGFDLTAALWGSSSSSSGGGGGGGDLVTGVGGGGAEEAACGNGGPRCEVLHQPLNQYWNGSCSAGTFCR